MNGEDPDSRPVGNDVEINAVSPAPDGSIVLDVAWDAPGEVAGNGHQPAANAIRLVEVVEVFSSIQISSVSNNGATLEVSWTCGAAPFQVQRRNLLGAGGWTDIDVPQGSRTISLSINGGTEFSRVVGQ
ncbi:MAG: hypothetical protein FJ405_06345 [Verrucomicrobia bacterium]|nr:hypothetical protein [Verrucomicrobiota bacterium]